MENKPPSDLPPFSLEQVEKMLIEIEDRTWHAGATADALKFIMGNLLIALNQSETLDVKEFIRKIQKLTPVLETPPRIAADLMLEDFHSAVSDEAQRGYVLH